MFRIRGLNGQKVFDTDMENEGNESVFATYEDAQATLANMEQSLPKGQFKIVATSCGRCGSDNDVEIIHVNGEGKAFCVNCRVEVFAKKKPVGRPTIGVTKKISLTLDESNWDLLDEKAKGNRSAFIREVVWNALGNESEWSNNACLGYAVKGLEDLDYNPEEIKKIIRAISSTFDMTSVPEAEQKYLKSKY